jgi:ATP-dependent DNA helicase RecG
MSQERMPVPGADLDDLDLAAMETFIARRAPRLFEAAGRDEAAVRLGLLARAAPRLIPTQVGLYVFGRTPQLVQPDWGVVAVAVQGASLADPIRARLDLEGDLASLLAQTLAFVRAEMRGHGASAGSEGDEYPEAAVREAVVNALVHRELRKAGRVAVRLFRDRLEIWSPGGPPEGLADLDELLREGGVSSPRNPILSATARALGIGEQLGRGLVTIAHAMSTSPHRVEIRTTPRDVLVIVPSRWPRPLAAEALS